MTRTSKITLSAMMAALATATMLLSFFPYLTYAIPAVAGLFIMVVVIEVDLKWAMLSYLSSAIISLLILPEPESKLLYVCFLGYYPVLKAVIEKLRKNAFEWILKVISFNIALVIVYFVFSKAVNFSLDELGVFGKYGAVALWLMGNAVFVLYDIAVSRMAMMYMTVLHPKIKGIFKF